MRQFYWYLNTVRRSWAHRYQKFSYQGLSPPRRLWRHRWNSDPYVLGGWAYQSTSSADEDIEAIAQPLPSPSDPRLLFAGEATDRRYLGTLLGARLVLSKQCCSKITPKVSFQRDNFGDFHTLYAAHLLGCTMELIFYRNAEAISAWPQRMQSSAEFKQKD